MAPVIDAWAIGAVAGSYAVGLFPTAQLVGRTLGVDPTRAGSGNPGASNVTRVAGWRAGLVVLLGDLAKGLLPTLVALVALGRGAALGCWLAATLGHVFPVTRRFRGGKGVATAGGGALVVLPLASVVLIVLFVIIVKVRHTASIGSITMAAGLPVGALATGRPAREVIVAALVGALVIARHADNIRRLVRHEEQLFTPR